MEMAQLISIHPQNYFKTLPHLSPLPHASLSSSPPPPHSDVATAMQPQMPPASASAAASSSSLVSRARTAIHSAAARAERVITDIKSDRRPSDPRDGDGSGPKPPRRSTEEVDSVPEIVPSVEEDGLNLEAESSVPTKLTFCPASVVKQLAAAVETGKHFKSVKEMRSNGDLSQKEKGGLSLSVVKSLVRREKEDRSSSEFTGDEETRSLMYTLFKLEEQFPNDKSECSPEFHHMSSFSKDLHGAPPGSFVHQIAEIIGTISSVHKMAFFWQSIVLELKKLWSDGQPVPRMPPDAAPDLNCCLLHQEIQVINCCIARKKRRAMATASLDSLLKQASVQNIQSVDYSKKLSMDSKIYARSSVGDYVLRLGADHPAENLTMLETGEPIYSPVLQEGPIMTIELIKETEEFVLRTGSVGAGCSQLLSDMQAFKAANPGCVLEDFIRWHSPPDWSEDCSVARPTDGEGSSRRGRLSDRMQTEGNLWRELWETAKPIPAVEQTPIYDEDLAVETIFAALEDIEPSKLFEQLLAVVLSVGFVAAEAALPVDGNLSKLFYDCKDYIISVYRDGTLKEKLDEISKVYESVEAIVTHPEEALQIMELPDEKSVETKPRFKRINLNFIGKDRQPLWKRAPKDEKRSSEERRSSEEKNTNVFSNLLDKKVSIFSKKNTKQDVPPPPSSAQAQFDESEWTIL